jgi:ATP/maltotriose-dependent transcriptional regulator MalT
MMLGPMPAVDVVTRCEALLADARRDPILEPTVLGVLANAQAMQGRIEKAEELVARWRVAVAELGDSIWLFAIHLGFIWLADDPVAAERELRPGYEALKRIGEKSHFSSVSGLLARAVCAQGRYDEADRISRESEEAARPNDIHAHILWRTARAQALAERGEPAKQSRSRLRATSSTLTATRCSSSPKSCVSPAARRKPSGSCERPSASTR